MKPKTKCAQCRARIDDDGFASLGLVRFGRPLCELCFAQAKKTKQRAALLGIRSEEQAEGDAETKRAAIRLEAERERIRRSGEFFS